MFYEKKKQLQKTFTWLEEPSIKNSPDALKRRIEKKYKRRRCSAARDDLIKNLGSYSRSDIAKVDSMAVKVGRCYKRYGKRTVLKYWNKIEKELSEEYGAIGGKFLIEIKAYTFGEEMISMKQKKK